MNINEFDFRDYSCERMEKSSSVRYEVFDIEKLTKIRGRWCYCKGIQCTLWLCL